VTRRKNSFTPWKVEQTKRNKRLGSLLRYLTLDSIMSTTTTNKKQGGSATPSSRYTTGIKRPTTANDTGDPTDDCLFDAKRVLRLIEDERYFSAQALYQTIRDRMQGELGNFMVSSRKGGIESSRSKRRKKSKKKDEERNRKVLELIEENEEILNKMEDRCRLFQKAKVNLDNDADWTLARTLFGVTTFYRHETDGSMSVKLEGPVHDCSMFDQLVVLRELDLNYLWAPFVTSSTTIAHLDKLDVVGWFLVGLPSFGLMRDALFRAIGCDSMYEDGSILVISHGIADRPEEKGKISKSSIGLKTADSNVSSSFGSMGYDHEEIAIIDSIRQDPILETLDLPPVPTRMGGGRLTVRSLVAQIHVESPTAATTKVVANIDPNLPLIPKSLLDFVMKRVCGAILNKMQGAANNIAQDPITNLHAIRIREDEFYKKFLLPKFEGVCKIRGWEMPSISAFGLSDAQLEMSELFMSKQKHKSEVNVVKHFSSTEENLDEYLESSSPRNRAKAETMNGASGSGSGPKVPTRDMHKDLDDMSDISKSSNVSFWQSNPVANYIRHVDEAAQRKRQRMIDEARARAAKRLKPKNLDEDSVSRLNELLLARKNKTASDNWMISLRGHGLFTKIFVLQFLMVSLFCLLYLDTPFHKFVAVRDDAFGVERWRDAATLTYIGISALVHSGFCYVALIYAFSALQLGLIAGKRTRNFYSEYVHYAVVLSSVSMVGLGVVKPGIEKILRWTIWSVYSASTGVKMALLPRIPDKITATLELTVSVILSIISSTKKLVLESNIIGRCIVSVVKTISGLMLRTFREPFATYADTAIKQYEGTLSIIPWREDTFYTTRALLSHSAFFSGGTSVSV